MPRLPPTLLRRAARLSPHLATLLPACRTLDSARAELRWIREHVASSTSTPTPTSTTNSTAQRREEEARIASLAARRGAGEPLQYVLGWQPFAGLEVRCARGVLIPRPETEAWAVVLGGFLFGGGGGEGEVRILDACSGTGCIGLSLFARARGGEMMRKGKEGKERGSWLVRVCGVDVEPRAVRLARRNVVYNFCRGGAAATAVEGGGGVPVTFRRADIFADEWMENLYDDSNDTPSARLRKIDVLVSNPPYISHRGFAKDTGRSVRNHEPKLALVPSSSSAFPYPAVVAPEDIFYARLLDVADALGPRVAVFEVGDMRQAIRVVEMVVARSRSRMDSHGHGLEKGGDRDGGEDDGRMVPRWDIVEIWRDWPDCRPSDDEEDVVVVSGREIPVRGSGHGRVVFLVEGAMIRNGFTNKGFRREVYVDE